MSFQWISDDIGFLDLLQSCTIGLLHQHSPLSEPGFPAKVLRAPLSSISQISLIQQSPDLLLIVQPFEIINEFINSDPRPSPTGPSAQVLRCTPPLNESRLFIDLLERDQYPINHASYNKSGFPTPSLFHQTPLNIMSAQPLPTVRRLVTGHNGEGKAIVWKDDEISGSQAEHGPFLTRLWSSSELPPDVNTSQDLGLVDTGLANNGTICRVVDFPPKSVGMVHRSITLDYIYVLEGEVTLTLDDGSRTKVKKGEIVVQQGTMHGWDNETTEWSRLLCILIAAKPPVVSGRELQAEVPFQV